MAETTPLPIASLGAEQCRNLEYFFCDIDDTMTGDGVLPASSYRALWDLSLSGIKVVPVTGRPAGWCDMIARFWPVEGIVGENGAFYFAYERQQRRMTRRELQPREEREQRSRRLKQAAERVLHEVPGSAIAADQPYRIADVAIDVCEDVPPLSDEAIARICEIFAEEGVTCKVSSIHVNAWFGSYDKVQCLDLLLKERAGISLESLGQRVAFIGDSPNDEPMFTRIPMSIGVANIKRFAERMNILPRYLTRHESAEGFVEAVRTILANR